MPDTMTPEAPAAKPRRTISEAHKAKLQAGREAALAKKRGAPVPQSPSVLPPPPPATSQPDERDAKIADLQARLAALIPSPEKLAALPHYECYVEFVADKRGDQGEFVGERLDSHTESRWESLAKWDKPIHGSIVFNDLVRNGMRWLKTDKKWETIPLTDPQQPVGTILERIQRHGAQFRNSRIAHDFIKNVAALNGDLEAVLKA